MKCILMNNSLDERFKILKKHDYVFGFLYAISDVKISITLQFKYKSMQYIFHVK